MRGLLKFIGPAMLIVAGLGLAACQGGAATGGGPVATSAPAAAPVSRGARANTASSAATTAPAPRVANVAGLKSYKVYNTTESLCAQTCKSASRCVNHDFKPIQTINGYVAGQCRLFGR